MSASSGDAGVLTAKSDVTIDAIGDELGLRGTHAKEKGRGWFTKLVGRYLRRYRAKPHPLREGQTATGAAQSAIFRASLKSAVTGASAGAVSTAATLVTAETEGVGGLVAIPVAAITIGGEMMYRSLVHLDLTCRLAEIFGVPFDPNDPDDLWRLYSLVFDTHEQETTKDPGKDLVAQVTEVEGEQVGEQIGQKVLGESVARNVIPFVGIVTSAATNFIVTRKLGHTVRRYMRYRRAMHDAFAEASQTCRDHLDLLIEGMWFIFTADGVLAPEETAILARMLDRLDPVTRARVVSRFVEDELEWADRIEVLPETVRDHFLHALEVAAAVDKEVTLPERKILRRAAHHLNREFDLGRLERMIAEFEHSGVLKGETHKQIAKAKAS